MQTVVKAGPFHYAYVCAQLRVYARYCFPSAVSGQLFARSPCPNPDRWHVLLSLTLNWTGRNTLLAMDPAAVEEFRKLDQEKNRLEADIKNLYDYLTEDGDSIQ